MINYKIILLIIAILSALTFPSKAQVAIGVGEPAKAALLQLKTQEPSNPSSVTDDKNITSAKGGLLLPRVKLKKKDTLDPFISSTGSDWSNNTDKIKETHAGLIVYNLTGNSDLTEGVYIWNGSQWDKKGIDNIDIKAANAITMANNDLQLGGKLNKSTEIKLDKDLTVNGTGELAITPAITLNAAMTYLADMGTAKILTSDADGNATWQLQGSMTTISAAVMSTSGATIDLSNQDLNNTGTSIELPHGRWIVFVTMLAKVEPVVTDRYWVKSTFVRENASTYNADDFEGSNKLVSARISGGNNIITGFVIMKNTGTTPRKFFYHVGMCSPVGTLASAVPQLKKFGSKDFEDTSTIIAFELRD